MKHVRSRDPIWTEFFLVLAGCVATWWLQPSFTSNTGFGYSDPVVIQPASRSHQAYAYLP